MMVIARKTYFRSGRFIPQKWYDGIKKIPFSCDVIRLVLSIIKEGNTDYQVSIYR